MQNHPFPSPSPISCILLEQQNTYTGDTENNDAGVDWNETVDREEGTP